MLLNTWFSSGTCRVLWYAFTRMGFGVHEGPSSGQSKRQPSDNCSGTHHRLLMDDPDRLVNLFLAFTNIGLCRLPKNILSNWVLINA